MTTFIAGKNILKNANLFLNKEKNLDSGKLEHFEACEPPTNGKSI